MTGSIHVIQTAFLFLLVFVAIFAGLARRFNAPYPIILVIAGLVISFLPQIPHIPLNPDLVFFIFLPPLLYGAAWNTSWSGFRYNLVSISMLAIGLVAFTVAGVALTASHIFPGFTWKEGFLLGAVVSTTDALAATSIAKRIGLPRQVAETLEGESLVNDATGLLALEFGLLMVVNGHTPTASEGILRLLWLISGGLGLGVIVGIVVAWFEQWIDDGPVEIIVSLVVPYSAYLAGDAIHVSGVLAVVACGLYLGQKSGSFFSPAVRIEATAVWDAMTFILNGILFILIGLQLPYVLSGIRENYTWGQLILYAGIFSLVLILMRMLWMFPGTRLAYFVRRNLLHQQEPYPPNRNLFVMGWTGMRGVLSLAAAISLPYALPQRSLIIFLAFSVILVTLVLQGLTLPSLIRTLGLAGLQGPNCEELEARRILVEEALAELEKGRIRDGETFDHVYEDLIHHYQHRLSAVQDCGSLDELAESYENLRQISSAAIQAERRALSRLRNGNRISEETLRVLERELDLTESRNASAL
jgi:monovalent cation/hydrogen antiporter